MCVCVSLKHKFSCSQVTLCDSPYPTSAIHTWVATHSLKTLDLADALIQNNVQIKTIEAEC